MATYYQINPTPKEYKDVAQYPDYSEDSRGLAETCEITKKGHRWLMLPVEIGQKEYLMCLDCEERNHF